MFRLESSGFRTVFLGPSWACFLWLHRDVCFLGRSLVRILADGFGFYRVLSVFGFRPIVKGFEYEAVLLSRACLLKLFFPVEESKRDEGSRSCRTSDFCALKSPAQVQWVRGRMLLARAAG